MSRKVLIVDDSSTTRMMVRRMMESASLDVDEVLEASNGIEALAVLADHEVAVVVLDVNMPMMNGVQLITRMKSNERLRHIPVVIASTEGSRRRIDELCAIGAAGFVRKPFQPEQICAVLRPLLGVSDDRQSAEARPDADAF